jgi:hypothetical protein
MATNVSQNEVGRESDERVAVKNLHAPRPAEN